MHLLATSIFNKNFETYISVKMKLYHGRWRTLDKKKYHKP